ncbi:MAG TPA: sulfite exporter TauE/SafE family protein [Coriobacteriia bacterium]
MNVQAAASVAVGFASGVLSGAFGIGGGLLTTPAITLLLGYPALIAVGTPLPVILPGALTGAAAYHRRGLADVRAGLLMAAVGAAGSVGGAFLSRHIGGTGVLLATAVVIAGASIDMLLQHRAEGPARAVAGEGESDEGLAPAAAPAPAGPRTWTLVAIGVVAGLYSGFLGLGGGFVVVPALTRWCGMPVKRAIGTSLVTVAALAIPGTLSHWYLGHIDWTLAALLAVGVVPGAVIGARLTGRASDRSVRLAFAVLLAVVGVWLAVSQLSGLRG